MSYHYNIGGLYEVTAQDSASNNTFSFAIPNYYKCVLSNPPHVSGYGF